MKRRKRIRRALKLTLLVLVTLVMVLITLLVLVTLVMVLIALVWFVADIGLSDLRSLATVEKVDDYPLYVMRYYGDYGLKDCQTARGFNFAWKLAHKLLRPQDAGAMCTCFTATSKQANRIFGRNYDWRDTKAALLLFTDPPGKYASVSMVDLSFFRFDAVEPCLLDYFLLRGAPYLPMDGMNECGVAVAAMQVPDADGGNDPHKETLGISCLMRQILDNTGSVEEAIELTKQNNIVFTYGPPTHLLIGDASGDSAVVEFIDGAPNVLKSTGPFQPSTNFVLSGKGVEQALKSCWRYERAYTELQRLAGRVTTEEAMKLLQDVSQLHTVWSAVYGQSTGKIQLAMDTDYDRVYEFSLKMKGKRGTRTMIAPIRPAKASWPGPADRMTISPDSEPKLTWRSGDKAQSHMVYLGADKSNLPLLAEVGKPEQLRLPATEESQTYYWRVDEVRTDGTVITGDVWEFSLGKLVGWWKLDGDVKDSSGNDHHGTIKGSPKWVRGRVGDGLEFDGMDDYVDTGTRMKVPAFTVAAWVKSPAGPSPASQSEVVSWDSVHINWDQPSPFFRGAAALRAGERSYAAGFGTLKADTWYHLCATYDGESLKAYKDAVLAMVNADPSGPPIAGTGTLKFARHSLEFVEEYFRGTIDDVRIYNYALSQGEITKLLEGSTVK